MEYKINQFNLSDIQFEDLKSLIHYFTRGIPRQKISNIYLGPNLINISLSKNKLKKSTEDKKLLSSLCQLTSSNASSFPNQNIILFSTSFNQSQIFLKRYLHSLSSSPSSESPLTKSALSFLSFFSSFKDESNDYNTICDYQITISIDNSIRFESISMYQINSYMLSNRPEEVNNINFFYMMLYNIDINEINNFLLCDETQKHFFIYQNNDDMDDYAKRYVLINQFKIIKNDRQYNRFATSKDNASLIKEEFNYYHELYQQYESIKETVMMSNDIETSIKGIFYAIILLNEYDVQNDVIFNEIIKRSKSTTMSSTLDVFSFIRNVIHSDEIKFSKKNHILKNIAMCLNSSEEKILFIMITVTNSKGKTKITSNKNEIKTNIDNFVSTLYNIALSKVQNVIDSYIKNKKLIQVSSNKKINIFIMRSNLEYEYCHCSLSLTNNPYFTISNNIIDANSFIITQNAKEHAISNYIQEVKNYIYLSNAMSTSKKQNAKNKYNDDFINSLFKNNFSFDSVLNAYENSNVGLIKLIIDDSNEAQSASLLKSNFTSHLYKKGICELIEVFNGETQQYQTYIKIKHSFGTFLYELSSLLSKANPQRESTIYKFLEYKPNYSNNDGYFKYNCETSFNAMKLLSSTFCYITMLIQLNKYNVLTLIDDLKINNIYYFYANFFNYVINVKSIRDKINQPINAKIDDFQFWKMITRKMRISIVDYYYENGNIFARSKLSNAFDSNKNISCVIFKYNYELFVYLLVEKIASSKFNYFKFAINGVRAFVKLTKIYNEKRVLSNVRNLLTDLIVDNYDIIYEQKEIDDDNNMESEIKFNHDILPQIDTLNELIFDFNKETLSKILPKLRSNLAQLKKVWKNYVSDINYLETNKKNFSNQECTQLVIEQRLINFQILLFLFSKRYKFINSESVKKYGVLVTEFTKTVSHEVLLLLNELYNEFQKFLSENQMNIDSLENINFEKLITKRIELQQISRKNSLKIYPEKEKEISVKEKEFVIPTKELMEGKVYNHSNNISGNNSKGNSGSDSREIKQELSFKNINGDSELKKNKIPTGQLLPKRSSKKFEQFINLEEENKDDKGNNEDIINNPNTFTLNKDYSNSGNNDNEQIQLPKQIETLLEEKIKKKNEEDEPKVKRNSKNKIPQSNTFVNKKISYPNEEKSELKIKSSNPTLLEQQEPNSQRENVIIEKKQNKETEPPLLKAVNKNIKNERRSYTNKDQQPIEVISTKKEEIQQQPLIESIIKNEEPEYLPEIEKLDIYEIREIIRSYTCPIKPRLRKNSILDYKCPTESEEDEDSEITKPPLIYIRLEKAKRKRIKNNLREEMNNKPLLLKEKIESNRKISKPNIEINKIDTKRKSSSSENKIKNDIKRKSSSSERKIKEDTNRSQKGSTDNIEKKRRISNDNKDSRNKDNKSNNNTKKTFSNNSLVESTNKENDNKPLINESEIEKEVIINNPIENNEEENNVIPSQEEIEDKPSITKTKRSSIPKKTSTSNVSSLSQSTQTQKKSLVKSSPVTTEITEDKLNLPSLKELDDKISQLKKELKALDIMENLTEQTSQLCFHNDTQIDPSLIEQANQVNKEFYEEIEAKLQMAEEALNCQFKQ